MIEITPRNIRTWSMLGQRGTAFTMALPELAAVQENIMVLTADLSLLSGLERFRENFPKRFLDVGIAEQNMMGIAAGLAKEGNCVFATTYASFITMRSFEQIRNNMGVMRFNVKVVGSAAGVSMGTSGNCHHSIEDIALMRVIPNMQVIAPADALETIKVMEAVSKTNEPAYIRLTGTLNCPSVYKEDYSFEIGRGIVLNEGLKFVKKVVVETADAEIAAAGINLEYEVGTMIEIPRAALTADEIAKDADFFCFGTNDLTQMTFGFSRDDAGKFLTAYYDTKIFENDPFAKLDQTGVGKLMETAIKLGKPVNPKLHVGICGEHGGDPSSVEFCHKIGLDYVSCSPFRVPIARLAAAQAAIANVGK